jgi:mono/diheme cytochrome c family protein
MKRIAGGLAALAVAACFLACRTEPEPAPESVVRQENPVAASGQVLDRAREDYRRDCSECHGAGGKGDGPTSGMLRKAPADLTDPAILAAVTDGEIYWIVTRGYRPLMPAFEGKLSEEQRWGLVRLMRKMSNTQPNSSPRSTH